MGHCFPDSYVCLRESPSKRIPPDSLLRFFIFEFAVMPASSALFALPHPLAATMGSGPESRGAMRSGSAQFQHDDQHLHDPFALDDDQHLEVCAISSPNLDTGLSEFEGLAATGDCLLPIDRCNAGCNNSVEMFCLESRQNVEHVCGTRLPVAVACVANSEREKNPHLLQKRQTSTKGPS